MTEETYNFVITTDIPKVAQIPVQENEAKVEKKKFVPRGVILPGSATVTLGSETHGNNQ